MFGVKTTKGQRKRERENSRARIASATAREIGPIPPPANPQRRAAGGESLRIFCLTYLPSVFTLPFSADHERVLDRMELAVRRGGQFAYAMPRGGGKTAIAAAAALWALLYGLRRYVIIVAATQAAGVQIVNNLKSQLSRNDALAADFPEVCKPIRALEGDARRCAGQLCGGTRTNIVWTADRVVLPTTPNNPAAGAVLQAAGLEGRIRGQSHTLPTGELIRPDLALLDDPQTGESARSPSQCEQRAQVIAADVLGLSGPNRKIAAVMPCTVIAPGDLADRLLDRKLSPEWQGERAKMLYHLPTSTKLWERYAEVRAESLRNGGDGREATEFYAANREAMDAGAAPGWPARYHDGELSAIQHAMNLKLRDETAFAAEYQNEPIRPHTTVADLTPEQVMARASGLPRYALPLDTAKLSAMIDVHDALLFFAVCAWTQNGTGAVVDYGTYPEQPSRYFTLRDAPRTLAKATPGAGREGAIRAGLEALIADLLGRKWQRTDNATLAIDRLLIDVGYTPDVIFDFIRAAGRGATIMGSRGVGIGAAARPMSEYRRQPGEQIGHNWLIPRPGSRELRHVRFDSNFWKTWLRDRLVLPVGEKGALTLYGRGAAEHRLLADHLTAEFATATEGRGRKLLEWRPKPGRSDNHLLDCLVGCAVAANMVNVGVATATPRPPRSRVRYF